MHILCPRCNEHLEFDGDCRGMEVQCPSCNHTFTVPTVQRLKRSAPVEPPKKNSHFLGFILGLFFSVIGVLIAYLVDGRDGAMAALRGILAQIIIGILLAVGLSFAY